MNWAKMESEERNRLVAEKVMGWVAKECDGEIGEQACSPDGWFCGKCGEDGAWGDDMTHEERPPRYTGSMTLAWSVLIHVHKTQLFSKRRYFYAEMQRLASLLTDLQSGNVVAWPDAMVYLNPEIICFAALKTVGIDIEWEKQ